MSDISDSESSYYSSDGEERAPAPPAAAKKKIVPVPAGKSAPMEVPSKEPKLEGEDIEDEEDSDDDDFDDDEEEQEAAPMRAATGGAGDEDDELDDFDEDEDLEGEEDNLDDLGSGDDASVGGPTNYPVPEDDSDNEDENYLQKLNDQLRQSILEEYHPESVPHRYEEIEALTTIVRDETGVIRDPLHTTIPMMTKYERTRILGERAMQLNAGAKPFIELDAPIMDGYQIALRELEQKKIPFIIKRPLPNGAVEYWKVKDLEQI